MIDVDVSRKARIVLVCGGSGTGKSAWVKQQIAKSKRLLIWDSQGEYYGPTIRPITGKAELVEALAAAKSANRRFAYIPRTLSDFDFWARCAFAWKNCTVVAEELADVTTPGKAPPGWGQVVRKGRANGIEIYAVTQRPAESDKTVIGNSTLTHCCKLKRDKDRAYMAAEMGCGKDALDRLKPLEWIEADDSGRIRHGKMTF
jgi:hypothetical protein